jgi:hypothetical protein
MTEICKKTARQIAANDEIAKTSEGNGHITLLPIIQDA